MQSNRPSGFGQVELRLAAVRVLEGNRTFQPDLLEWRSPDSAMINGQDDPIARANWTNHAAIPTSVFADFNRREFPVVRSDGFRGSSRWPLAAHL